MRTANYNPWVLRWLCWLAGRELDRPVVTPLTRFPWTLLGRDPGLDVGRLIADPACCAAIKAGTLPRLIDPLDDCVFVNRESLLSAPALLSGLVPNLIDGVNVPVREHQAF